jgi:hypothetical protein
MRKRVLVLFAVLLIGLAFPFTAIAGSLTLHPAGFGEHSRANWKAQQGLPDNTPTGNPNQALYFQKMTSTATFAAGVAVIRGLEGQDASVLSGLQWYHRVDGHCGAGAPRWNVNLKDSGGNNHTVFLGCYAAAHTADGNSNGFGWCVDTWGAGAIAAEINSQTGGASGLSIRSLAIIFDEGTDNPIAQPPGCPEGPSTPGFVYLDNISVTANGATHTWKSASDNGNKAYAPLIGPSVAFADEVVPTSDILSLLQDVVPGVPLTSWILYPDVEVAVPGLP